MRGGVAGLRGKGRHIYPVHMRRYIVYGSRYAGKIAGLDQVSENER